ARVNGRPPAGSSAPRPATSGYELVVLPFSVLRFVEWTACSEAGPGRVPPRSRFRRGSSCRRGRPDGRPKMAETQLASQNGAVPATDAPLSLEERKERLAATLLAK